MTAGETKDVCSQCEYKTTFAIFLHCFGRAGKETAKLSELLISENWDKEYDIK